MFKDKDIKGTTEPKLANLDILGIRRKFKNRKSVFKENLNSSWGNNYPNMRKLLLRIPAKYIDETNGYAKMTLTIPHSHHTAIILNTEKVERIYKDEDGDIYLYLTGGYTIFLQNKEDHITFSDTV